jgi:hypothetical protein
MSNNKQSSVEWLWSFVEPSLTQEQKHFFSMVIEQAKAMHKTEHFNTWWHGISENEPITFEQYYNETFGGNNDPSK